jgi:type II restriction enzyme
MRTSNLAKKALDLVIRKSRVHLYKPIQIAEILYHQRTNRGLDLSDLESYRNISKHWRDAVSLLLVGRRSTSSQKYQDNIFEANAMPPALLAQLGDINKKGGGFVEAYIYKALEARLSSVRDVETYIKSSTPEAFSIKELVALFQTTPGLRRSIDKMYEILVYALFATIARALKAQITLEIGNKDAEILKDFERFIKMVLGIDAKQTKLVLPAALYRVGVTNAADEVDKLDNWAEDVKKALELDLKKIDIDIKTAKTNTKKITSLEEKLKAQREIKDWEKKRNEMRKRLFETQDGVELKKEKLLESVEAKLSQQSKLEPLFTIKWKII